MGLSSYEVSYEVFMYLGKRTLCVYTPSVVESGSFGHPPVVGLQ
jgi:DNA polymerase sigma